METVLKRVTVGLAATLASASTLVLLGWHFRVPALKGAVFGSFVAPSTALCFLVMSAVVLFQLSTRRWLLTAGQILAFLVFIFSLLTLSEWISGNDLGIDRLFFAHRLDDWYLPFPGRFAVNSCIGFATASLAVLTSRVKPRLSEACASVLLLLC